MRCRAPLPEHEADNGKDAALCSDGSMAGISPSSSEYVDDAPPAAWQHLSLEDGCLLDDVEATMAWQSVSQGGACGDSEGRRESSHSKDRIY